MRRTSIASSCFVLASLVLGTVCPSSGASTKPNETATQPMSGELDKLMRTRMNSSYSQLVFLVFHAEGEPDFMAISEESARLSEAVESVLKLQMPPVVQSEQARSVYVEHFSLGIRRQRSSFESTSPAAAQSRRGRLPLVCRAAAGVSATGAQWKGARRRAGVPRRRL